MRLITIILTCLLGAWFFMIVRDRIKGVRNLKERYKNGQLDDEVRTYDELIAELDDQIKTLSLKLEDNIQLEVSRKQKRKNRKIETKIIKLSHRRNGIDTVRHELEQVIDDLKHHYGEIPTVEMQKHLNNYLNNKYRIK